MMPGARRLRLYGWLLSSSALVPAMVGVPAAAAPRDGQVVAGAASVTGGGRLTTITQTSNRAIINWQSFSVGAGQTVRFSQPSALSAVLNRVTGLQPSLLLGKLQSNGQVYLINPNGVVVGPHGVIDTHGFVASTLNIPDAAFMQGGSLTFKGDAKAGITNLGTIRSTGGDVALIALTVVNRGSIAADGQAILASGGEVLYVPDGQSEIAIRAGGLPGGTVDNQGMIAAAAVQLRAAGSAYALAVNNGGQVSATSLRAVGGRVVLDAGAGDAVSDGTIGAPGGTVTVRGGRVAVGGTIDVSAAAGGGGITLAAGNAIAVGAKARLLANATGAGDGGRISVKAGGTTRFAGTAQARGGARGGQGGTAEISGGALSFAGSVDLSAPLGRTGTLVFDPTSITVVAGNAAAPTNALGGIWDYNTDPGAQTISAGAVATLLATTQLNLNATASIDVSAAISSAAGNALALNAPRVSINAPISLPNAALYVYGGITSIASGQDATPVTTIGAALTSAAGATITAQTLHIDAYDTVALAGAVQAGTVYLNQDGLAATGFTATNAANQVGTIVLGSSFGLPADLYGGAVRFATAGALTVEGVVSAAGGIGITAGGDLTLSAADVTTTQLASSGGQITLAATGGAFVNNVGSGVLAGTGRRVIYTATDGGAYNDGGLGYATATPVPFGSDPDATAARVIYIAASSGLPVLTVRANDVVRLYGQADAFSAAVSGGPAGSLVTQPQFRIAGGADVNVGQYMIEPFGAVATGYRLAYADGTLTVNPAPLVITPNLSAVYGSAPPTSLPAGDYAGFVNGDGIAALSTPPRIATGAGAGTPVGSYSVTASGAVASNYAITYAPGTLQVTPAALTITPDVTRTYGAALPAVLPTADFAGLVAGDTPASLSVQPVLTTAAGATAGVGRYGITAAGAVDANYTITYAPGHVQVTPAPLVIGVSATQTYGGAPSPVFSYGGFVNNEGTGVLSAAPQLFTTTNAASPVGQYAVSATGAAAANYQISYSAGTLRIDPAPLTITANPASRLYGAANPALGYAVSGLVNGEAASVVSGVTLATTATTGSGVGNYPITAGGGAAANYTLSYVSGTLRIDPAPLTVTANPASRLYGAANPAFGYMVGGLVNGDAATVVSGVTLATTAGAGSGVGSYPITAGGGVAANYAITYMPGTLSVTPAPLTVTPFDLISTYGATPAFGFYATGLVNGDAQSVISGVTFSPGNAAHLPVGNYAIGITGATAANYTITAQSGALTIGPAPLQVVFTPAERTYGTQANPTLQVASVSGLVNGDTYFSVFGAASPSSAATATSPVGAYPITLSSLSSNYTVSESGSLTVTPAPLTLVGGAASRVYSSNLTPSFSYTVIGLRNGDSQASAISGVGFSSPTTTLASPVGTYSWLPTGGTSTNYVVTVRQPGSFTITPAPVSVSVGNVAVPLYEPVPTLSYVNQQVGVSQLGRFAIGGTAAGAGTIVVTLTTTADITIPPAGGQDVFLDRHAVQPTVIGSYAMGVSGLSGNYVLSAVTNGTYTVLPPYSETDIYKALTQPASVGPFNLGGGGLTVRNPAMPGSPWPPSETIGAIYDLLMAQDHHASLADAQAFYAKIQAGDPTALGELMPYLFGRMQQILLSDPSTWSADDLSFVNQMRADLQQQRQAAAQAAWNSYQQWQIDQRTVNTSGLMQLYYTGSVPPPQFLQQATGGFAFASNAGLVNYASLIGTTTTAMATAIGRYAMPSGLAKAVFPHLSSTRYSVRTGLEKLASKMLENPDDLDELASRLGRSSEEISAMTESELDNLIDQSVSAVVDTAEATVGAAFGVIAEAITGAIQVGTALADAKAYDDSMRQALVDAKKPISIADLKAMATDSDGAWTIMNTLLYQSANANTGSGGTL